MWGDRQFTARPPSRLAPHGVARGRAALMSTSRARPVQVPAKGKADYTIEFVPLAMTSSPPPGLVENRSQPSLSDENGVVQNDEIGSDGKLVRLSGSLFFALPDGGAVLYQLEGFSEGPEAASTTELETPAKTALAFTVPVANWLRRPQRCRSVIDSHIFRSR